MRRPSLSWSSAAKIAWREMRASKGKFLFVILSIAIGVAALTGVRSFSSSFQETLSAEARTIMAADLSARIFRQPTTSEEHELDSLPGVKRTRVAEMMSMASSSNDPVPLLISLKAVDPQKYPFYGAVQLDPAGKLDQVLNESSVVVAQDLLIRLHTQVGSSLKIGNADFRIAAVLLREPDRMTSSMGLGPRVLMSQSGLAKSGLVQQGSRTGEKILFKLPGNGETLDKARDAIEQALPDAQVTDFREANPALSQGLERSTGLLSLICLVAMVLGAIGVAMAMRAHLQQRVEVLAIMKSLGARSSGILRIYLVQTLLLGLAGALIGIGLGLGVERIFPSLLGHFLPMHVHLRFSTGSALAGLGTGILTTVLFCLPPLLNIRRIRPNLVMRRMVEESSGAERSSFSRIAAQWREDKAQWIAAVVILAGLASIAAALTGSATVGRWFAAALCALLIVVLLVAAAALRILRAFLQRTRLHLQSAIRHGLANLYRPGNQSAAVLAALGLGVMLVLTVFLMQSAVVDKMKETAAPDTPNVFLIDISAAELPGIERLAAQQPGIRGPLETLPVVSGRVVSVDGTPAGALKLKNFPRRLLQSVPLSWSQKMPPGNTIVRGAWGDTDDTGSLAVSERIARRLHLRVGSEAVLAAAGRTIPVRVSAIFKADGQHIYARSEFILQPKALAGLPAIWYGAAHVEPAKVADLQRALFNTYPTVTVINIADVIETIQGVVRQITVVVRFLAAFSILAGILILASSVASTRFRRVHEVVVLKMLGARRSHIVAVFSVEFVFLGLLAGVVGVIFANLLSRILLHRFEIEFHVEWLTSVLAILATAALATATGWLASFRILGQRPLQVLREE